MPDMSRLVLNVKSDSVEKGADRLDHLSRSATKAGASQKGLATATGTTSTAMGANAASTKAAAGATAGYAASTKAATGATLAFGTALKFALGPILAVVTSLLTLGKLVSISGDLEHALSGVSAVTGAVGKELQNLEDVARDLGATTVFSAKQAADGMQFLGMAGFETSEIIAAMPGLLDLAAAGQLELAQASDIATNVLSGFRLGAEEAGRVGDVLAKGAASSNTSVFQLGKALSFTASVSASLGKSLEETAAAIGVLSDNGTQGQRAGTGLRTVLSSLSKVTPIAEEALGKLGLTIADVDVQSQSLQTVFGNLSKAGLDAKAAFKIFGTEGATAALALTSQVDNFQALQESLENAEGAAGEMAITLSNDLHGSYKRLGSVASKFALTLDDAIGASGLWRDAIDLITKSVGGLSDTLGSWTVAYEGWADDFAITSQYISDLMALSGKESGERFVELFIGSLKTLPIHFRNTIQRVAIELATIVDYGAATIGALVQVFNLGYVALINSASVAGVAIGKALNPFDSTDFSTALKGGLDEQAALFKATGEQISGVYDKAGKSIVATREARLESLTEINTEFHEDMERVASLTLASGQLRASYESEKLAKKAARGATDTLAPFKIAPEGASETGADGPSKELEQLQRQLQTEEEAIEASFLNRLEIIRTNTEKGSALRFDLETRADEELSEARLKIEKKRVDETNAIQRAQFETFQQFSMLSATLVGQIADMAEEGTDAQKALFLVQKGISIAQAIINTELAATRAPADAGPILGMPLATAIRAMGYASVGVMVGQTIGSFATGGIVPGASFSGDTLTASVNSGEMILNGAQQARLFDIADNKTQTGSGGVNITVENYGSSEITVEQLSENDVRIIARDTARGVVREDAPSVIASDLQSANSRTSRSLSQNTKTERRR